MVAVKVSEVDSAQLSSATQTELAAVLAAGCMCTAALVSSDPRHLLLFNDYYYLFSLTFNF